MRASEKKAPVDEIRLLIFNIADIHIGLDMDQIHRVLPFTLQPSERETRLWFHDAISIQKSFKYHSPIMLEIKNKAAHSVFLIIDRIEQIDHVLTIDRIRPMPDLIDLAKPGASPVWGACISGDDIIFLVDIEKLLFRVDTKC